MSSRLRMTRAEKDALAEAIRGTLCYRESEESEKPTVDVMPVVRCKDCKHYNTTCCADGFGWCEERNFGTDDDWFCADGEPKEDT